MMIFNVESLLLSKTTGKTNAVKQGVKKMLKACESEMF